MAIAVIGGLLVSTVLSLVFVPSFFTVMDDVGLLLTRLFGRFIGPADEPDEEKLASPLAGQALARRPPATEPRSIPLAAE